MPGITDYRRYEKIIASSPLFSGFAAGELESIIKCLSPSVSVIEKDGTVFFARRSSAVCGDSA